MTDPIIEEKFKLLFSQHIQKTEKGMQLLKDTIQALSLELQSCKNQIADLRTAQAKAPAINLQQETQKVLHTEEKPAVHPRQGNYKPGDVDIKKMFYFGHK